MLMAARDFRGIPSSEIGFWLTATLPDYAMAAGATGAYPFVYASRFVTT
jgi:hypothetical protein